MARQTYRRGHVALVGRSRGPSLDQLSVGVDLPPELLLRAGEELVLTLQIRLDEDLRPVLLASRVRAGEQSWGFPPAPPPPPAPPTPEQMGRRRA